MILLRPRACCVCARAARGTAAARRTFCAFALILSASAFSPARAALTFNFIDPTGAMAPVAMQGFQQAGTIWSSYLIDPITVNIEVGFQNLGPGILADAGPTALQTNYTNIRSALAADAKSATDLTAVGNLPNTTSINFLINYTAENGNSATPYLDNNNSQNNNFIVAAKANFKALGYTGLDATFGINDAIIRFNNQFTYDFDRSNGIDPNAYDFVGLAVHEIGHALGFVSGVDIIDQNPGLAEDNYRLRILDLYRFSDRSATETQTDARSGTPDITVDDRDKFFSIDRGISDINGGPKDITFSNGLNLALDRRQASHWKDSPPSPFVIGALDPTAGTGEQLTITNNDLWAMDVIGYDLAAGAIVPEPSSLVLLGFTGAAGSAGLHLRRRQRRG